MFSSARKRQLVTSSRTQEDQDPNESSSKSAKLKIKDDDDMLALKVFLNPETLEAIVKHLPTSSLLVLRLTCKLWNTTIVSEYRNRNLNFVNNNRNMIRGIISVGKGSVGAVIDVLKNCVHNPFNMYRFNNLLFNSRKIQALISKIGPRITRLNLIVHTNSYLPISRFRDLIWHQTPNLAHLKILDGRNSAMRFWKCNLQQPSSEEVQKLPNLKSISFVINTQNLQRQNGKTTSFLLMTQLIDATINLKEIEISYFYTMENPLTGMILEALRAKTLNLNKLQTIKCSRPRLLPNELQILVELSSRTNSNKLQLKEFDLDGLADECFIGDGLKLLNTFLVLQALSLEKLAFTLNLKPHNYVVLRLPVMICIKTLEIESEFISYFNQNFNPDDYKINIYFESLNSVFPALRKLSMTNMYWMIDKDVSESMQQARQTKWDMFIAQLGSHHGITQLKFILYDEGNCLQDLAFRFPNVTRLNLELRNELFPSQVWSVWPRLERLDLRLGFEPKPGEIDSSITGISVQSLNSLKMGNVDFASRLNDWKKYKIMAGISDLNYLSEFNLFFYRSKNKSTYLTDFSGYFGFAAAPALRRILLMNVVIFHQSVLVQLELL